MRILKQKYCLNALLYNKILFILLLYVLLSTYSKKIHSVFKTQLPCSNAAHQNTVPVTEWIYDPQPSILLRLPLGFIK